MEGLSENVVGSNLCETTIHHSKFLCKTHAGKTMVKIM